MANKAKLELTEREQSLLDTVCTVAHCYRQTAPGMIYCLLHLHGASDMASDEAIAVKRKVEQFNATTPGANP